MAAISPVTRQELIHLWHRQPNLGNSDLEEILNALRSGALGLDDILIDDLEAWFVALVQRPVEKIASLTPAQTKMAIGSVLYRLALLWIASSLGSRRFALRRPTLERILALKPAYTAHQREALEKYRDQELDPDRRLEPAFVFGPIYGVSLVNPTEIGATPEEILRIQKEYRTYNADSAEADRQEEEPATTNYSNDFEVVYQLLKYGVMPKRAKKVP